jgi:uncharacterized membrane protein
MLFASVALNLFLAGLWMGTIGQRVLGPAEPPRGRMSARITSLLDEADRVKVARNITELDAFAGQGRADIDGARDKIVAVVGADIFEPEAFAAALAAFHDQETRMHTAIDRQISVILLQLPQHTRARIAEEMFSHRPPFSPPPPPQD